MMKNFFEQINLIEIFGVSFSIAQVLLARYNYAINYLFGIAGVILTLFVMFDAKLYAEFGLNLYYLVMSIYGWFYWKYGKKQSETVISKTNTKEWYIVSSIVVISFLICYFSLNQFTDSDVPLWDSLVSAFAWAGMWLMAKRKLENWIVLNISNAISIPLMIHKELYLYAVLSIVLFVVAISGYLNWKQIVKTQITTD